MATWLEIKQEIHDEMDLAEETFIDDEELLAMANSGIEKLEAAIIAEVPNYFKSTPHQISLVSGTQDYSMPTDIYANKINLIYYENGSSKYEIHTIKDLRHIMNIQTGERYRYLIVNSTASGTKIRFYPTPAETTSNAINIFYTRNITRLTADADTLDIPEGKLYIKEFVKEQAAKKERMTPDAPESQNLKEIKADLIAALATMIVDENNLVTADMSSYEESVAFEGDY